VYGDHAAQRGPFADFDVAGECDIVGQYYIVADDTVVRNNSNTEANSIEYRDTGVILDIIPRVNASGLIVLDIIQEVSNVVETTTSGIDSPTIRQRKIESTVAIHSGDSVVLGGLIRDSDTRGVSGVPLVSEIPILGNLFKTTESKVERTELLVLITPRIVRDRVDAQTVTEELRKRLRALEEIEQKIN